MSPALCRSLRFGSRLAGASLLFLSLAAAALASPGPPVARLHPAPDGFGCAPGAIDDLLVGDAVDLGRREFELRRLGEGFALEALEMRSEGICGDHGEVLGEALVASTTWVHGASGGRLSVTQRQAAEPVANLLEPGWAVFWWQGYAFQVSAAVGCGEPPLAPDRAQVPRRRAQPVSPPRPPCSSPGENLLAAAVLALAPDLDLGCFHRRREGAWSDLGSLGLGDPRTALPPGYEESYFHLSYLEVPAAGCGGPLPDSGPGVAFSSDFFHPAGGWAAASAFGLPPGAPPPPGYMDEYSASWSDGTYQFSVAAAGTDGAGDRELVRALAAALDSGFSEACLVETRLLAPAEAEALGFQLARPPAGFFEAWSQLTAQVASPECQDPPAASYSFYWSFFDGAELAIEASLGRSGAPGGGARGGGATAPPEDPTGGALAWTDAQGTSYSVFGYSYSGGPGPAEELLVAVARSMDPTFGAP
jgi:hypothetical protein